MSITKYQETPVVGTLYETTINNSAAALQGAVNVFANAATTIYGSNSATQPTALSQMFADTDNAGFTGIMPFTVLPRWIAFTGTATELKMLGVRLSNKGAIS